MQRFSFWVVLLVGGAAGAGCGSGTTQQADAGRDGDAGDARTGGKGGGAGGAAGSVGDASVSSGGQIGSSGGTGAGGSPVAGASGSGGASGGAGGVAGGAVGGAGGIGGGASGGTTASGGGAGGVGGNGGRGLGGAAAGGSASGGAATGGASTGGSSTGGAASGGMGTGGAGTGGAGTGGAPATSASMFVVGHPDDDILFMNPNLETAIQSGNAVTTVYVTSGDGNDPNVDWMGRETSIRAAHAAMAGVASSWTCATASYGGKLPIRCVLAGKPTIRTFFLRLRDSYTSNLRGSSSATSPTIDSSTTYTAAALTAVLTAIVTELNPASVGTLDATLAHGFDHADHVTSAIFTLDAARADGTARQVTLYRGYSIYEPSFVTTFRPAEEPENLSAAQYQEKLRIVHVYQPGALDDPFDQWCHRFYPITQVTGAAGPVHNAGLCLQASGTTDGSTVTVATCTGSAAQTWTVGANSRVVASGGKCLAVGTNGTSAIVETCSSAADQRWTLLSDGQLHGTADTCLTVSGSNATSATCGADTSQTHFFPPASQRWSL